MDFIDDDEKMRDFFLLTKDEFLKSYNYLSEENYNATKELVEYRTILEITYIGDDNWDRPVYKDNYGKLYKDTDLGHGNNLRSSLCTANNNEFDGEPLAPIDEDVIVKVIRYVPIKDIRGNEDLHKIAQQINFETNDNFMPEDTKRDDFLHEIKTQIEWELDMVSPSVNKRILNKCYEEILEIETKEITSFKENIENFLKTNEEYEDYNLSYIFSDKKKLGYSVIMASNYDEMIRIQPYTLEVNDVADWAYNFDEDIFEELENGREISYMSMDVHYSIWCSLDELYPEEITHKKGVQMYLKYCKDNKITKELLKKENGLDVPNVMKYYKTRKETER